MAVFKLLIQFQSQRSRSKLVETCLTTRNKNFFHAFKEGVHSTIIAYGV